MPLTPKNRKEEWIQDLVDHETTLTPKNRQEEWMKEIIDASGGTGGGVLILNITQDNTLDKTWLEIKNALNAGQVVTIANYALNQNGAGEFAHIVHAKIEAGAYKVVIQEYLTHNADDDTWLISATVMSTDNENGYPAF